MQYWGLCPIIVLFPSQNQHIRKTFYKESSDFYVNAISDYQSFCMADIIAIFDGGKSLATIATKKYPTKNTEPANTNIHPQNVLSLDEIIWPGLQEELIASGR